MSDLQLEIIDPLTYPGWDELLLRQESYSFFHSSHWARVLHESYRYRPFYFVRIDQGKLSVLMPIMEVRSILTGCRGVALPFTDYCEPVLDGSGYPKTIDYLARFGKKAGWASVEIRAGNGCAPDAPSSSSYLVHTLDLRPGPDELFKQFRDTTRRNIKKAIREGVEIKVENSANGLDAFYGLNCETRKDHGLPPQPYFFFENLYEHVISKNLGFVALAYRAGYPIAGAVYLYSREKVIYKYGASLRSQQHLRANNLVMWKAIQSCSDRGYKSLCFGRTDPDQIGLRQFKSGWGARERTIHYFKYDLRKEKFVENHSTGTTGLHVAIGRHLPIPLLKIAGRILYRHVG